MPIDSIFTDDTGKYATPNQGNFIVAIRKVANSADVAERLVTALRRAKDQADLDQIRRELPVDVAAALPTTIDAVRSWLPFLVVLVLLLVLLRDPSGTRDLNQKLQADQHVALDEQQLAIKDASTRLIDIIQKLDRAGVPEHLIQERVATHLTALSSGSMSAVDPAFSGWIPRKPSDLYAYLQVATALLALAYVEKIARLKAEKLELEVKLLRKKLTEDQE